MNWLRDFSYRFTPTIAARLAREPLSNIPSTVDVLEDDIVKQLHTVFSGLSAAFSSPQKSWSPEERKKSKEFIERTVGFSLNRRDSQVSGQGIFVNQGKIRCGQMASLYPGTVYLPGEPMLIQSINNHYVLRCQDGLIVDGNANGISARIHRSCALRDVSPMVPDLTWLDRNEEPINCLNMGQYVNNGGTKCNVQYVDVDIKGWHRRLRPWLPYAQYSSGRPSFRMVVLVACKDISCGEELLSAYVSR